MMQKVPIISKAFLECLRAKPQVVEELELTEKGNSVYP